MFHADLNSREQETFQPVHVINVDIQDNHEEATLGAFLICELCQCVSVTLLVLTHTHTHYLVTRVSHSHISLQFHLEKCYWCLLLLYSLAKAVLSVT